MHPSRPTSLWERSSKCHVKVKVKVQNSKETQGLIQTLVLMSRVILNKSNPIWGASISHLKHEIIGPGNLQCCCQISRDLVS